MKKIFLFFLCLMLAGGSALYAQTLQVTGIVTDGSDGSPLPGAYVMVKGTTRGSSTDANGRYTISASANDVLQFTFIGMKPQEIAVAGRSTINVVMESDAARLEEVVVLGYGVGNVRTATAAVSTVGKEALAIPVTSFDKALQGNVAGVVSLAGSGQPGAGQSVVIRGVSSLNAGTEPLYILDGVPVITGATGNLGTNSSSTHTNALASINPNDIENITILKDAAATSIYGSRATNGVILITTKRGQAGKTQFTLRTSTGFSSRTTKNFKVLNRDEYIDFLTEARINAGFSAATMTVGNKTVNKDIAEAFRYRTPSKELYDFDWQSHAYSDNAPTHSIDFTMSGGADRTRFYLSFSYSDQTGTVIDTKMKRYTGRLNLDHQISNKLKTGLNILMSYRNQTNPHADGSTFVSPMFASALLSPLDPGILPVGSFIYNLDGTFSEVPAGPNCDGLISITNSNNFLANSAYNWHGERTPRITTNGNIQYNVLDGLILKAVGGFDYTYANEYYWRDPRPRGNATSLGVGSATHSVDEIYRWIETITLNYIKSFGNHNVNLLLGQEAVGQGSWRVSASATPFPGTDLHYLSQGAVPLAPVGTRDGSTTASFFSSLNYNFNGKYLFSASLRGDGSSRLAKGNRWATFWSTSASWRMAQESFIKQINWINKLDLRASYGVTGNQSGISSYEALGLYSGGSQFSRQPGTFPSRNVNPKLSWERVYQLNFGLDGSFLKNRLSFVFDWYQKNTKDMLLNAPLSYTSGFSSIRSNVGEMWSRGIEFAINSVPVQSKNLRWNIDFNIFTNWNCVTKLEEGQTTMTGANMFQYEIGRPFDSYYMYRFAGINPADGRAMYYDQDMEIVYATNEKAELRQFVGTANPDFQGGITNRFSFKGFDLSFMFFFTYGGGLYDGYWSNVTGTGNAAWRNQHTSVLTDTWRKEGDIASYAKPQFNRPNAQFGASGHTGSLFDGSYVRLRDVSLGYNLPKNWVNAINLTGVRIYTQATNLWTLTRYPGADPETSGGRSAGYVSLAYPNSRTITFGIDLRF